MERLLSKEEAVYMSWRYAMCVLINVEGYLGVRNNLRTSIRSDQRSVSSFSMMESRELRMC